MTDRAAGRALVAVDLDQTLIYSPAFLARAGEAAAELELLQVEDHAESGAVSYMAAAVRERLDALRGVATVVPVTTRTRAQFERIGRLGSIHFDPIVCANGGIMLVAGEPDEDWAAAVMADRLEHGWTIDEAGRYLDELGLGSKPARLADGLFWYVTVVDVEPAAAGLEQIRAQAVSHGWEACLSGRKLYLVPETLTKAHAVKRLAARLGAPVVVAVGDSVLDLPMLRDADLSIAPAHADPEVCRQVDRVTPSGGPRAAVEALDLALAWLDRLPRRNSAET
jgi:phosphoserine phosphatase